MNKPLIIFTPSGQRGRFAVDTPVLTAARMLGVDLDSVCGGRGICSKCQITPSYGTFAKFGITVDDNALSMWNSVEQRYHDKRGLQPGRRLGCQATIQSDVIIDVPAESQLHKQVVRKRVEARDIVLNSAVRLYYVEVHQPDMHNPSGDFERLALALQQQWKINNLRPSPMILRQLQPILRQGKWRVTVALHSSHNSPYPEILKIWPGYYSNTVYGVAIDLGSTTIAAHLCCLQTGEVVASAGIMNPQIRFGEDLMSRVSYAMMNATGAEDMTAAVRDGICALLTQLCTEKNIDNNLILNAVFVCNPIMHHLLLDINPFELGQAPFALASSKSLSFTADQLDLNIHPQAPVYILPCIAGHVGADAAAVALSESPNTSDDLVLVVDVGTNAEIILGNKDKVFACSSPTGPAFEGAQISSGQRAAAGAIERVTIDPISKNPRFRVIGCDLWSDENGFEDAIATTGVTGICGSGIIEMVAEMRLAGLLDASGLIGSPQKTGTQRCFQDGRTYSYEVFDNSGNGGMQITVTNRDIREIQMAKAALYAGVRLLMDKFGVDKIDRIVLAGAFGAHISPKHAVILGLIPDCDLDKITSAGNAAGTGARIALLNINARRDIEKIVNTIEKIETAIEPRFQEHFVNASAIPNSVETFPILSKVVSLPNVNFNITSQKNSKKRRRRRRKIT